MSTQEQQNRREFDIIIFGASGFVGYYAIRDLYQSIQQNPADYGTLRWAIAGRRIEKLEETLSELSDEMGVDFSFLPRIIADVGDDKSLSAMTERTKVLLNCVGPYLDYGRPVVEACIRSKTHHFDLSGKRIPKLTSHFQSILSACQPNFNTMKAARWTTTKRRKRQRR